jgi:hypothetical protein
MNLPVTSVRDIDVHGNDVVIGTHGRAFWMLDDVTPLRQMDARDPRAVPPVRARRRRARAAGGVHGHAASQGRADGAEPPAGRAPSTTCVDGPAAGPVAIRIADAEATHGPRVQQRGPAARHGPGEDPRWRRNG